MLTDKCSLKLFFFYIQADVKIQGLPLKLVMEAIQQATGELRKH